MIYRIMLMAIVLFGCFYGLLSLCFTKGWLTREKLHKLNRVIGITFIAIVLVGVVMGFLAGVDHNL